MSFAFNLSDACRATEAALAQHTAHVLMSRASSVLSPDDVDYLRTRINSVRLKIASDAYLKELFPSPKVAIGLKNNAPLQYAAHVLGQMATTLTDLSKDCSPESLAAERLASHASALLEIRKVIDDATPTHLRRDCEPIAITDAVGLPGDITVAEIVARYLADMEKRLANKELVLQTVENNRTDLLRFADHFGTLPVADLKQHDLTAWLDANPQWKAVHSRRRISTQLIQCFRWAAEEEYIVKAPFKAPRALRGLKPKARRPADPREYVLLMRKGSRQLRWFLFLLWNSGARTCELRTMRWSDIRLDDPSPHIHLAEHKTFKQTGLPRIIPLCPIVARVLRARKRNVKRRGMLKETDRVCVNTDGTPWDRHAFARHLRRTAKKIGLDNGIVSRVSGYMFRHSFAVENLEAGADLGQVADVMGLTKVDTLRQYYGSHTKHRPNQLGETMNTLDKARRKSRRTG